MRVENDGEGPGVTGGNSPAQRLAFGRFLANTSVAKDDAGDARQSQGRADRAHDTQEDDDIGDERYVGHHAGSEVINEHEGRDGERAVNGGPDAAADGISAEGRVHFPRLDNVQRGAKGILQSVGEFLGLAGIELTGDLTAARLDGGLDNWSGAELTIEDDSHALMDIFAGDFGKALR